MHVKGYVVAGDMRFKTNRRSIQKIKGKHAKGEKKRLIKKYTKERNQEYAHNIWYSKTRGIFRMKTDSSL